VVCTLIFIEVLVDILDSALLQPRREDHGRAREALLEFLQSQRVRLGLQRLAEFLEVLVRDLAILRVECRRGLIEPLVAEASAPRGLDRPDEVLADLPLVGLERLLEVGRLVGVAAHLLAQGLELLLVLEEERGLLARPVVVGDDVVNGTPAVLLDLVNGEVVVAEDVANALAIAVKRDHVCPVVIQNVSGRGHLEGAKKWGHPTFNF